MLYRIIKLKESNDSHVEVKYLSDVAKWMNEHNILTEHPINEEKRLEEALKENLLVLERHGEHVDNRAYGFIYKEVKINNILKQVTEEKWELNENYRRSIELHFKISLLEYSPHGCVKHLVHGTPQEVLEYLNSDTFSPTGRHYLYYDVRTISGYSPFHNTSEPLMISNIINYKKLAIKWVVAK